MKLIGVFIILITGFWFSEGMFNIENILWFLFGIALVAHEEIKEMIVYFWKAKYERK